MDFIFQNMGTIIVSLMLITVVILAVHGIAKRHKKGGCGCGCGNCIHSDKCNKAVKKNDPFDQF